MANFTSPVYFHIVPFSCTSEDKLLISAVFTFLYLFGGVVNAATIAVIYRDSHLHTPMYLLLCNLSIVDICYTTVIIPKLLEMLLSGKNSMSFRQCFTQLYFFFWTGSTEDLLLFAMAYDRYVAICNPLRYQLVLSWNTCILMITSIWFGGCLNGFFLLLSFTGLSFCRSDTIQHFFCDSKALTKISCSGTSVFSIVMYIEFVLFGLCPFVCTVASYVKIINIILCIKSMDGRKKAFSTCTSHLTVLLIYYVTVAVVIVMPESQYADLLEQVFTVLYATVAPMVNPLIYSLRNKDVKKALLRLVGLKSKI
ncbi:olfactory receptor 1L4-like [Phyllobates terribilis]|uniref:olfactory receptor 1L4-like n=1 Tax=Phyllobates terribilis TaxID=111132 RepID=UPI003CCA759F